MLTLSRRYVDPSHRHIWYLHLTFSFVRCQTGEGLDLQTNLLPTFGFAGGTFLFKISLWNPWYILVFSFSFPVLLSNHMHLSHSIKSPFAKNDSYNFSIFNWCCCCCLMGRTVLRPELYVWKICLSQLSGMTHNLFLIVWRRPKPGRRWKTRDS